ncbi:MAG: hypothetical protein QXZ63_06855 [Sulfolobales archaeon]
MTHTHHRTGPLEELKKEFTVLITSSKFVKYDNEPASVKKALEILVKHEPINYGNMAVGNRYLKDKEEILSKFRETCNVILAVFDSDEKVKKVLKELKEADLGLSVVVSGVYEEIFKLLSEVGLSPHTINLSLGVWGKTEKLPPQEVLEITTMCGHGMVSPYHVNKMISEIEKGKLSPESAVIDLARPCICGIVNTKRAEESLRRLIKKYRKS